MADNSQLHFTNIAQPYIPIYTAAPPTLRNTHTFEYFFRKTKFQNFLGPFPVPQGLLPLIFEFPHSRYITSNFFRRSYPLFSWPYSGAPDVSTCFFIYTAAPHNTLSYTFSKNKILKIFRALSRGPRGFCHHFRISLLPLHNLQIFPTFLPHFFMVLLRRSRRFDLLLHLNDGTSQHTRFPILFPKIKISKFLGPFPGPQGLLPTIFIFTTTAT